MGEGAHCQCVNIVSALWRDLRIPLIVFVDTSSLREKYTDVCINENCYVSYRLAAQ